jgi:hypothetical protein
MDQRAGSIKQYQQMGCYMTQEATRGNPSAQESGIVLVADCANMKMSLFSPSDFKRGTRMFLDCFPVKIKAIYLYNLPRVASMLLTVLKKVLSKKMGERIQVVGKGCMTTYISAEHLPASLGGSMRNVKWDNWVDEKLAAEAAADIRHDARQKFTPYSTSTSTTAQVLQQEHGSHWIDGRVVLPLGNTSIC